MTQFRKEMKTLIDNWTPSPLTSEVIKVTTQIY